MPLQVTTSELRPGAELSLAYTADLATPSASRDCGVKFISSDSSRGRLRGEEEDSAAGSIWCV